ncbi:hypothetical protein KKA95_01640 [Patescibacteria group bacterium]|nr:hypothetical protein [Patescibacteria group bacterium]
MVNSTDKLSNTFNSLKDRFLVYQDVEEHHEVESTEEVDIDSGVDVDQDYEADMDKASQLVAFAKKIVETGVDRAGEALQGAISESDLASDPNTSEYNLRKLEKTGDESVKRGLAENPNTPSDILVRLASSSDLRLIKILAKNPNLPAKVAQTLLERTGEDFSIAIGLQENRGLPGDILFKLAEKHPTLLRHIIKNPNVSDELLQNLVKIPFFQNVDTEMKNCINDPRVSADTVRFIYENLGKSATRGVNVLYHIMHSPNTPDDVLESIIKTPEVFIANTDRKEAEYSAMLHKQFAKEELEKRKRKG